MRKNPSLFGEKLRPALLKEQFWLQAEKLPAGTHLPLYVDKGQLHALRDNASQLIVGRRGTGKTHLFEAFQQDILETIDEEACILISMTACRPGTPLAHNTKEKDIRADAAHELFDEFLKIFWGHFLNVIDNRLKQLKGKLDKKKYKPIFKKTNDKLIKLLETIEEGRALAVDRSLVSERQVQENQGKSGSGGFGFNLDGFKPKANINLNIGADHKKQTEQTDILKTESRFTIDLYKVRKLVLEILDCSRLKTLHLLIDEWMEIDKKTPSKLQAGFAQLLKVTFFNDARISVKIASIWHETTLYDRDDMIRSKGIQLGHDIIVSADLDTAFLNTENEVFEYCKNLLFRRLAYVCPELLDLEIPDKNRGSAPSVNENSDAKIDDAFITEIFDNTVNFRAFIAASHGIPRELMANFHKCTRRIRRDFAHHCIDVELIARVASNHYNLQKRKRIATGTQAYQLLSAINDYMDSSNRRMFIVKAEDASRSEALRKLVDEEIIHQIPSAAVSRPIRDTWKAFQMDYGNYADLLQSRESSLEEIMDEIIVPHFPDNILDLLNDYEIPITDFPSSKRECHACGSLFSENHPVFLNLHACPLCASSFR